MKLPIRTCAVAAAFSATAWASGTMAWEMNSYGDFIRGRFEGVSLSRDGRLTLAPKLESVFASGQPVVWSVVRGADGSLYAATGHRGRVYRIDPAGKSSLLWTADQPEVFALALGGDGALYAGTSPNGKVWRIVNGKAEEYFAPGERYIWSLAVGAGGALYVGTGDKGKVFRVDAAGMGKLWYETGQSHVTGMAVDTQGRLLAGTEPNGILYRITARDKAFVLYDSNLPEIRAIVPMSDGTVYAAALGGATAKRMQNANQPGQGTPGVGQVQGAPISITVEAQNTQPGAEIKPPAPEQAKPQQQPAASSQVSTQFTPVVDMTGVERSAVYRINPDNTVETLWSSKEENVYDLLALERQILFSTDVNGRIYGLSPDRRVTLVAQTNEAETTRLLAGQPGILAATGNTGHIYRLDAAAGPAGSYEAPVHDSGTASRWGSLSWRADVPKTCAIQFRTRSGNSARPDRTWSEWSAPLTDAAGSRIASPNARYIEWKLELSGAGGASPVLNSVTLAYLPQNSPPVVKSINVMTQAMAVPPPAKTGAQSPSAPYTVTVSDTGDASASAPAGTPTQTLSRAAAQQITISWQAEDPDGDRLIYSVYFRGDDEQQWKLLKSNTRDNALTFDADVFADGKYFFRVVASDKEANPPQFARDAQLVSAPVMIDNTPPVVAIVQARNDGGKWRIDFEASDSASPLRRCEYSLDAANWVPVEAADGVIDELREKFALELGSLPPGEHLLVIRAADSANNTGVAKRILR
jgi:outer membrane protein assembly factor BamB